MPSTWHIFMEKLYLFSVVWIGYIELFQFESDFRKLWHPTIVKLVIRNFILKEVNSWLKQYKIQIEIWTSNKNLCFFFSSFNFLKNAIKIKIKININKIYCCSHKLEVLINIIKLYFYRFLATASQKKGKKTDRFSMVQFLKTIQKSIPKIVRSHLHRET